MVKKFVAIVGNFLESVIRNELPLAKRRIRVDGWSSGNHFAAAAWVRVTLQIPTSNDYKCSVRQFQQLNKIEGLQNVSDKSKAMFML